MQAEVISRTPRPRIEPRRRPFLQLLRLARPRRILSRLHRLPKATGVFAAVGVHPNDSGPCVSEAAGTNRPLLDSPGRGSPWYKPYSTAIVDRTPFPAARVCSTDPSRVSRAAVTAGSAIQLSSMRERDIIEPRTDWPGPFGACLQSFQGRGTMRRPFLTWAVFLSFAGMSRFTNKVA